MTYKKCIYFAKIKRKKYSPFCDKFLLEINVNIEKNNNIRRKNHAVNMMEMCGLISNKIYFLLNEKRYINMNLSIYVSFSNYVLTKGSTRSVLQKPRAKRVRLELK